MKPKLLIALGDSFTEGWGNYDPVKLQEFLEKNKDISHNPDWASPLPEDRIDGFHEMLFASKSRFLEYSWPNVLKQMAGFDRVINVGRGGTSVSGQLKRFMANYGEIDFSNEYDVTLIWLIPSSLRISFFINGLVQDIHLKDTRKQYSKLVVDLMELMNNPEDDLHLERDFYIQIIKYFCQAKNYKFYFDFVFKEGVDRQVKYLQESGYLNIKFPEFTPYNTSFCLHFNELGYSQLAKNIFDRLTI
jgi:hypothetical protein